MPGNGVGDRVHNFFAQENLPQGPRSQVDGNWASNDNLWVNSQKQFGVSDPSPRNFNPQQSETERGHSSQPIGDPHIFNISQTNTRPEFARNLSQSNHEQQNTNGYMYNRQQSFQTRPDEANFMGIDAEYGRNNVNVNPRGFYGSQQESVPEQQQPQKNPFRSESSEAPHGSFDLFGGQHQSNSQYPGLMQQQQQQQQSGFGDIQQLQQQLMLRKMQELQRQQEIQRQEQQNSLNQASLFARQQASGSHSHGLVNGTPTSEPSGYGWTEPAPANPNWLHRAAPGLHHPDQGQPQRSMGFVQQQVEPSLYGVPVSNSRNPINQYPNRNSFPGNNNHNYGVIPEQHIVQSKGLFGSNTFGQGSNSGMKFDHMQQQNTVQESPAAMVQDKSETDAASLDPDEEKILFGSDDNIWGAFGNSKNVTGGMSSLLDDNEFGNNLPSLQSGSWSALMQSAVAETTSTDVNVQAEWPDLNFQNPQPPAGKQHQNLPKMDTNIMGLSHQHSSGGSNWLNHGASVPAQQTFQNYKQNQPSVPNLQPNNHHLNLWKHVDSSKGSENSDKSRNRLNKGSQISESSFNSSDKEDSKTHEMESSSKRENSNDSYRSGSSHLNNTVGPREMFSSDGGDSRTKQSLTSQTGRKTSVSRKFQYHPMGNLDEDSGMPFGTRQSVNMKGNFGHLKPSTQGYVAELDGVPKGSDDMRFKGMIPGHMPKMFSQHDRSAGLSTSDKASQPSQNMLDLLHKVDQSRDRGIAKHMNSTERNLSSEIPEPENSDGSFGGQQKSQSSNSQGIGLQLGPPSQRLPMTMLPVKPNSLSQTQASANQRGKGFHETSQGQTESQTTVHKMMTNFSAASGAGFPNARSQLQNHPPAGNDSFNGHISQIRQSSEGVGVSQSVPGENLSAASQPRGNSGVPQQSAFPKMLPNAWSNTSQRPGPPPMFLADQARKSQLNIVESTSFGQQKVEEQEAEKSGSENLSAASQPRGNSGVPQQSAFPKKLPNAWSNISQPAGPPPMFLADQARKSQLNFVESTSFGQQKVEEQEAEKSGSSVPKYGAAHGIITGEQSTEKVDQSQTVNGAPADNDSINPRKDLEAFGRTLKPSNFNQQYSLLNQMKAMRNAESDPNNRALKRLKDSDNMLTGQQVKIPTTGSLPASLPSKVAPAPAPDQNGSRSGINPSNIMNSSKIDISPQMAPSWFDQYGTFKTGQMLSQRADSVVKTGEQQPFNIGKISGNLETINNSKEKEVIPAADINQGGVILPSTELTVTTLDTNVVGVQNLAKKRKSSTAELHPWFKEVSGRFQNLQGICAASTEWCDQSNRLMEKVEDDGEIIKDIPRTKKRIILSTHLMQQLFPPPPATVLSTDAISSYESVAFYAARLALADSCNLVSNSRSNSVSDKSGESERTDDHHISEAVEDCFSKANKLENDFSRLNKRASILDLRVEYQDLEKFSIINRFAKFHGRGQTEGESSSVASANTPKPAPQRYVIAVALPKNLPERVQCMSL